MRYIILGALSAICAIPLFASTLQISDPRPLSEASFIVSKQFKIPVDYEDTYYDSVNDRQNWTVDADGNQIQADTPAFLKSRTIVVNLADNINPKSDGARAQAEAALRQAIQAHSSQRGVELFTLRSTHNGYSVVATGAVMRDNHYSHLDAPLDKKITLDIKNQPLLLVLRKMVAAIGSKERPLTVGSIPSTILQFKLVSVKATNEPARVVLRRLIEKEIDPSARWHLLCGAYGSSCALNLFLGLRQSAVV